MTVEPIVMSREWLDAVQAAVTAGCAHRTMADPLRYGPETARYWRLDPKLPRCPHPACIAQTWAINVDRPNGRYATLNPLSQMRFEQYITLTWESCGHTFRVPLDDDSNNGA